MSLAIETATAAETLRNIPLNDLPGWTSGDHAGALAAFQRSCTEIETTGHGFKRNARYGGKREDWMAVCNAAGTATDPRSFFEEHFLAFEVNDPEHKAGLLTGYYEPQAEGSLEQSAEYPVPIYAKPSDLVAFDAAAQKATGLAYGRMTDGNAAAYHTRKEIESGALAGRGLEIAWLKSWEDAFFIHIQGSGRVMLPDGGQLRLSYAAKTGLPYTGIGSILIKRGILTRETNSMQSIRAWMRNNPDAARELMWQNQSFVFFRKVPVTDSSLGALGAQQVHLTPERSIAVDRSRWMLGTPVWIDTVLPPEAPETAKPYRRLLVAQDTGTAIRGAARGDVFWGWGKRAEMIAGHMKSPARFVVLLPKSVAASLGLAPGQQ